MGKGSITEETNSRIQQKGIPRKQEKILTLAYELTEMTEFDTLWFSPGVGIPLT